MIYSAPISAGSMQLKNKGVVQYEYWYYEGIPLLFAEMKGVGDYVYIPNPTAVIGLYRYDVGIEGKTLG